MGRLGEQDANNLVFNNCENTSRSVQGPATTAAPRWRTGWRNGSFGAPCHRPVRPAALLVPFVCFPAPGPLAR